MYVVEECSFVCLMKHLAVSTHGTMLYISITCLLFAYQRYSASNIFYEYTVTTPIMKSCTITTTQGVVDVRNPNDQAWVYGGSHVVFIQ